MRNIHDSNILLCIWWDLWDVVYYELLKPTETIMGNLYRLQLMRLSGALKKNGCYMSRDMTKWFCSMITLGYMLQNEWKPTWKRLNGNSYPEAPYSPEIAPIITCSDHATWPCWAVLSFLWRCKKKKGRFKFSLKRCVVFQTWKSNAAKKMVKTSG